MNSVTDANCPVMRLLITAGLTASTPGSGSFAHLRGEAAMHSDPSYCTFMGRMCMSFRRGAPLLRGGCSALQASPGTFRAALAYDEQSNALKSGGKGK